MKEARHALMVCFVVAGATIVVRARGAASKPKRRGHSLLCSLYREKQGEKGTGNNEQRASMALIARGYGFGCEFHARA
jgi:hypothetical protein